MKHMKFFKQACIGIVAFAATIVPCMNVFASNAAAESTSTKQEEAVDDYYIYDRTVTIGAVYGAGYSAEKQGWQVIVNFKRVPTQEDIAHGLSETLEFAKPIFDYSENKGRWEQEFSLKSGYYNIVGVAISPNGIGYRLIPESTTPEKADDYLINVSTYSNILLCSTGEQIELVGYEESGQTQKPVSEIIDEMKEEAGLTEETGESEAQVPGTETTEATAETTTETQNEPAEESGGWDFSDYLFFGGVCLAVIVGGVFVLKGKV